MQPEETSFIACPASVGEKKAGLPEVYQPPRRTLLDVLMRAGSFDRETARMPRA